MRRILPWVLAMGMAFAAVATSPAAAPTNAELTQQVRETERAFARSMAERKLEDFSSRVSAQAVFIGGRGPLRGKEAVVGAWKRFFEGPRAPFSWEAETVEVLDSGTLALSSGPVFDPERKQIGVFNSVWRLEDDGQWRIVFDKGCDFCPPETPKASGAAGSGGGPALGIARLADGLWLLTGDGGNVVLGASPDGALMIDAEVASVAPRLLAVADSLTGRPPRFLVNTHYHFDHTGGDSLLATAGAGVVAQANVYRRMIAPQPMPDFGTTFLVAPSQAWPAITFEDSISFHLGGREARVIHVPPAHTDGDAIVWLPGDDVLLTGDLFFNGEYPYIDVTAGGSIDGMIRGVDRVLAMGGPRTRFVPGHGPAGDRAALERYRGMLTTARDRVTNLVREGKSLAEVQAAKPLADLDAAWGQGFMKPDAFLKVVYNGLVRDRPGDGGR